MRTLSEPPGALRRDDNRVAPCADAGFVVRPRGRLEDEDHILLQRYGKLLGVACVIGDDRTVIARPTAVHGEPGLGVRGRAMFWHRPPRSRFGVFG